MGTSFLKKFWRTERCRSQSAREPMAGRSSGWSAPSLIPTLTNAVESVESIATNAAMELPVFSKS